MEDLRQKKEGKKVGERTARNTGRGRSKREKEFPLQTQNTISKRAKQMVSTGR